MTGPGQGRAVLRVFALSMAAVGLLFPLNNYLIFWRGWPGIGPALDGGAVALSWLQLGLYAAAIAAVIAFVGRSTGRAMIADADSLSRIAAFIARAAFWSVLLIGLADMVISFLRVEGLLGAVAGAELAESLGRSRFRGNFVHYPLIAVSVIIAASSRAIGFTWLALLIVLAELQIVIARFVFSYEQAFMGDLVRFWYAALFLFASAYTLLHEGHVRVDVLYTGFGPRGKAWTNAIGSMVLGVPLCWIVLTRGMWDKANLINAPLLSYETTQSGYGMYVKYLMAGFLVVYAVSMLVQFLSQFLTSAAVLLDEPRPDEPRAEGVSGSRAEGVSGSRAEGGSG